MATKAGTHDVAGDRNCCASCSASAAVPEHAGVNLPGIATVVRYRDLPALDCHGDKLGVGLHLGPTGWMEWHTPEHGGRQTVVPAGSLSLVPARGTSGGNGISHQSSCWLLSSRRSWRMLQAMAKKLLGTWSGVPGSGDRPHALCIAGGGLRRLSLGTPLRTSLCTALAIHLVRRYAAAAVPRGVRKGGLSWTAFGVCSITSKGI